MNRARPIILILVYCVLGCTYALITPVFEAGDELWHYPMVANLADGNRLPVQTFDEAQAGLWKQQASQPPLYYYISALLTRHTTASLVDLETSQGGRWDNPHRFPGVVTTDGNINLTIHDPAWNPWQGTLFAVRIIRLLSIILGAITVYCTYRIGLYAHPHKVYLAIASAAMVAFLPMFLFISAAINNDNLIMMLSAASIAWMIRFVIEGNRDNRRDNNRRRWINLFLMGGLIGTAALSKIIGIGLLPLALGTLFIANWRDHKQAHLQQQTDAIDRLTWQQLGQLLMKTAAQFTAVFATAFTIAGWWYIRNIQLYGDWTGWNAFIAVLGKRPQPASLAQLWDERIGFMQSYWGLFGGVNIPLPALIYTILNWVLILSVIGFTLYIVQQMRHFVIRLPKQSQRSSPLKRLAVLFNFVEVHFAFVVCILWTAAVVYGLTKWATTTWSSQGRLVFSALPAQMTLLTTGLFALFPDKIGRALTTLLISIMFLIAALAPWLIIRPAYQPSDYTAIAAIPITHAPITFDDTIRLNQTRISQTALHPGDALDLYLEWEMVGDAPTDENWSVFVHLNDPVINNPVAQRDKFMGDGLIATSFLRPGDTLSDKFHLDIPTSALTPNDLELIIGLYKFGTPVRATTDQPNQPDSITLATMPLRTAMDSPGTIPNPMATNFENELTLIGYSLANRVISSTTPLSLTLYLNNENDHLLEHDYSISAQLLSENETELTRWGNIDLPLSTTTWQPHSPQTIPLEFAINPKTEPGIYRLILKIYTQQDGNFINLQQVEDGRITNTTDFLLTKIRVSE